jgi:DNA-binding PadR family transcriptional regulator
MSTGVRCAGKIPAGEQFAYDPRVAVTALGETTAPLICVGLLRQKPDTVQGLDRRLKQRFASASFTRGSANKSITGLVKQGLVELVERGDRPTLDRYRITPTGEEHFLEWLRQAELPPMVRDALQCKLEFFGLEEMPGLIDALEEQAIAFGVAADIAHEDMHSEQRRRRENAKRGQPPDWRLALSIAKTKVAANLGHKMRDRLNEAVEELKEIYETFSATEGDDE